MIIQCAPGEHSSGFPDQQLFLDPPARFKANAGFGMMLDEVDEQQAREQIRHFHERGFGGVFITAGKGNAGNLPDWYVEQGQ